MRKGVLNSIVLYCVALLLAVAISLSLAASARSHAEALEADFAQEFHAHLDDGQRAGHAKVQSGHSHGHNPSDHSHEVPALVNGSGYRDLGVGRQFSGHFATMINGRYADRLERPPRA